jgi:hypothetical protein
MKVTQPDSRSITIVSASGVKLFVPYRFFWNGHERMAESIALSAAAGGARGAARKPAWDVRAFFLFGEIRDRVTEDAFGIALQRTWIVKTAGLVHLSVDIEMEGAADLRWLFPGVHAGEGIPKSTLSFLGEKTTAPSALFLSAGGQGTLVFSRSSLSEGSRGAIGIGRTEVEDEEPRLRIETRFPGIEEPRGKTGPRPDHQVAAEEEAIESSGTIERTHELFLAFAPGTSIQFGGPSAAFSRLMPKARVTPASSVDRKRLAQAVEACLPGHYLEQGGVAGIREHPGSPWLSSSAGVGLAVALRRLFPTDQRLGETALRLADFTLKGQVAAGFFYEGYNSDTAQWQGVRGRTGKPLLSLGQSALIAERLLLLAADLEEDGLPHEKYYLAGLRFVDFFMDEKAKLSMPGSLHSPADRTAQPQSAEALGGLELFHPMARILQKTGKDRYRKGMDALVKRFSSIPWDPFKPPASRDGRSADAIGALLAVRLFLAMRTIGYHPAEPTVSTASAAKANAAVSARLFASLLVPWVRLHPAQDGAEAMPGCLVDSFSCQRVIFAGYQTAHLLLGLRKVATEPPLKAFLRDLARLCLEAAGAAPIGSSFLQHTRWDAGGKPGEGRGKRGPIDSRRLASEVLAGLDLARDFPKI